MKAALPDFFSRHPFVRRFTINLMIVTVINVLIALFITYLMRTGLAFSQNLVFALCIGTITWLFLDPVRALLWGAGRPPLRQFFLLCLIAIPGARILGDMLAVRILGIAEYAHPPLWEQDSLRFVIFSILISAFVIWVFWNRAKLACLIADAETEKARSAAIEKQAMQAQLQLLQAQIEPHMLFNTLANLQGLIAVDTPRAQHMLEQLIVYLRATLTSSRAEKTTLAHEFALMDAYLELMSIRMGSRLTYTLQLPEQLNTTSIPPMLLQPLIENAIKHGIEPKVEGGSITVIATQDASTLHISVADTGVGLQATSSTSTNGTNVGLANVRERLQALYGDQASLSLTANTPTGVLAQLNIPLS
jgi:signal transduction histidine kinase